VDAASWLIRGLPTQLPPAVPPASRLPLVPLEHQVPTLNPAWPGRGGTLLFPGETGVMLTDWRKLLDRVAERAGWRAGEIRSKMFRHTYCAARLQTLDGAAPVSPYTVARELGHGSVAMVEQVYSHLGAQRHRSAVVEYRVEQHAATLGGRLEALQTLPRTLPGAQESGA